MKNYNLASFICIACLTGIALFLSSCFRESSLCGDVLSDTTWEDRVSGDRADYIIDCIVTVDADLNIAPGVIIQFTSSGGIVVESGGSISANGTATDPIVLRGEDETAGSWMGVFIKSNNVNNRFSYTTISHGGSSSFDGHSDYKANIRATVNSQIRLDHCTISESAKDGLLIEGLYFDTEPVIMSFSENTFNNNAAYPISTTAPSIKNLDGGNSSYSGNGKNKIDIRGGYLYGTQTWESSAVPYHVSDIVKVGYYGDEGNLIVEAGTTIEFAADQGMCVGEYSSGYISMVGTAANKITLTGESSTNGAWKGICFQSTNALNKLEYVDILYGGSSSYTGASALKGNVNLAGYSAGNADITNCTIAHSGSYGIYAAAASPYAGPDASITFSDNNDGDYIHD